MHPVDFILQLVLASVVLTTPLYSRYAENSTSATVDWSSCPFNGSLPINCGSLVVPLDYTDPHDNEKVRLDLVRVPAAKTPSKGSILFNFGGPGYEARQTLATLAIYLQGYLLLLSSNFMSANRYLHGTQGDGWISRFDRLRCSVGDFKLIAQSEIMYYADKR